MTEIETVLHEVVTNGAATSGEVAEATGLTMKRASTYLARLARRGEVRRGEPQRTGSDGRPAFIYWPQT